MKVEVLYNFATVKPVKKRKIFPSSVGETSNMNKKIDLTLQTKKPTTGGRIQNTKEHFSHMESGSYPNPSQKVTTQKIILEQAKQDDTMVVSTSEITAFFRLFDDDLVQDFLWMDSCCKIADKYLLAMVFTYFKRANYTVKQFHRHNFFIALYLANDMEEDEEDPKYEIFSWALGRGWRDKYPEFLRQRDRLLKAIDYRAAVSRRCCEEIMNLTPDHIVWQRERKLHHAGAKRKYSAEDEVFHPRGPGSSPEHCSVCHVPCKRLQAFSLESPFIVESPDSGFLYLSSCTDSSSGSESDNDSVEDDMDVFGDINLELFERFDMKGLKRTLQQPSREDETSIWAH